jgi:alanine racemase
MHLSWIEISRSALLSNLQLYRNVISPSTKIMSVVKADAYGHGLKEVASIIAPYSDFLMVNTVQEALTIRKSKIKNPILIAAPISPSDFKHHFSLCAHSLDYLNILAPHSVIHLKINTGTNRLGLKPSEIPAALKIISKSKLEVEGIYTHFHSSDSGSPATQKQFRIFQTAVQKIRMVYPHVLSHCASSSASLLLPETRLDMIRLGISLYGLWPDSYVQKNAPGKKLFPVLSWKCLPVQIRRITAGETVSYAATYTYQKPGVMAVLPIGYSDGYDRKLSNTGRVWFMKKYCPVIGRVAMNFTMIDVSKIFDRAYRGIQTGAQGEAGTDQAAEHLQLHTPNAPVVELLGPHVPADEIASLTGTINYEVVSRLSSYIPKIIIP